MKLRLTSRIILIFVLFASALLAGVGMLSYRSGREALFTALTSEILAMAMEKQAELDHWFEERVTELKRVGTMEGVRGEILLLNRLDPAAPETAPARGRLVEALRTNMDGTLTGYLEILLLNTKGEIIASTQEGETGKARGSEVFFERGKETVYINSPALSEPGGVPYIMVSLPVRSESGKLLAVLAGRLDITTMGTIVQRRTGLRETDDAFLVNPAGIAVTQPRFLFEPAVLTRRIDTQAVRLCIRGNSPQLWKRRALGQCCRAAGGMHPGLLAGPWHHATASRPP